MPLTRAPGSARRIVSLLGGLSFFLSLLEFMIPKPLPFIRLGLANLPLLLALDILPFRFFMILCALKIFGQALLSGTLFSYAFLFSLCGTCAAAFLMYALRKLLGKRRISFIGISAAGALASNAAVLIIAYFFVFGVSARYIAFPVLAFGIITGTCLGICAEYFAGRSSWYAGASGGTPRGGTARAETPPCPALPGADARDSPGAEKRLTFAPAPPLKKLEAARRAREAFFLENFRSGELVLAGLCMIPALLLNPNPLTQSAQFLFFYFLSWLSGKKNNPLITFSVMAGIIFFNLLIPYGEVLLSLGPLSLTKGALLSGLRRAATLEGLFMLSRCCVRSALVFSSGTVSAPRRNSPRVTRFLAQAASPFAEIVREAFLVFSRMAEERPRFNRKNWAESLDELLIGSGAEPSGSGEVKGGSSPPETQEHGRGRFFPRLVLVLALILAWLPCLESFIRTN